MFLLNLVLFIFAVVIIIGFITQVILPLYEGNPLFPLFRGETVKEKLEAVEDKLEEAIDVAAIQQRVNDLASKVSDKLKTEK